MLGVARRADGRDLEIALSDVSDYYYGCGGCGDGEHRVRCWQDCCGNREKRESLDSVKSHSDADTRPSLLPC